MGERKAGVQRETTQFPHEGTSTVRNMAKARAQNGGVDQGVRRPLLHFLRSPVISSYRPTRKHLDSKSHHNCKPPPGLLSVPAAENAPPGESKPLAPNLPQLGKHPSTLCTLGRGGNGVSNDTHTYTPT